MNGRLVYFSIIIIGTAVAVAVALRSPTATIVVISEVVVLVVGIGLAVLLNKMGIEKPLTRSNRPFPRQRSYVQKS